MLRRSLAAAGLALGFTVTLQAPAAAQGSLNMLCAPGADWCEAIAAAFQRDSGIRVAMTRKSSGEILAQLTAEAQNPRTDLWFGGSAETHITAAERNLLQTYTSPNMAGLHDWAIRAHRLSNERCVGVSSGAIGITWNRELMQRRNLPLPRTWDDLVNPAYRGEIQMANPNSSGTAYIVIATLVQMMGEDPAFAYLRQLHGSINAYPRSGTAPITAVARGETALSISFVHNAAEERAAGFPVGHAVPCEGTGYEIGSMSIIRGARNLANAQRFYHWALSAEAQLTASQEAKKLQTMANRNVPLTDGAPNMATARIIDYDNARFGASAERRRLLARWDREVGALPR
jgi:iron(III) transport system substrate-binding protein